MKKYIIFILSIFIIPICFVNAQSNKIFIPSWSALEEYIPINSLESFEMVTMFTNIAKFNDDYIFTSLDVKNTTDLDNLASVIAIYDQIGNEKYRTNVRNKAFLEIATSSENIYALAINTLTYSEITIIKYDKNLKFQKEVSINSNLELIITAKMLGFDLFQFVDEGLFLVGQNQNTGYLYDENLNPIKNLTVENDYEYVCNIIQPYCTLYYSEGPEYIYAKVEKDEFTIESGASSTNQGFLKLYNNNELVFKIEDFNLITQPQIVGDNIVAIGLYGTGNSYWPQLVTYDFEGNIVSRGSSLVNLYNVSDGNTYITFSLNLVEGTCPSYAGDNCIKVSYDLYSKDYIGGTTIDEVATISTNNKSNEFYDIARTSDDGYIVVGYDDLIVKYSSNNTEEWRYSLNGNSQEYFNKVIETKNGDFVIVGKSNSTLDGVACIGGNDAHILKLDKNGNLIWSKRLAGNRWEEFNSVVEDADGNYIAVGYTESTDIIENASTTEKKPIIVKYDSNGNIIWKKFNSSFTNAFTDIVNSSDEGYVVIGIASSNYSGTNAPNGFTIKYDNNGNVLWENPITGVSIPYSMDIELMDNKYYVLITGRMADITYYNLSVYDENGETISQQLPNSFFYDYQINLSTTLDENLLFLGPSSLTIYDKNFNKKWSYTDLTDFIFNDIVELCNNEFIIVGRNNNKASVYRLTYNPIIKYNKPVNGTINVEYKEGKGIVTITPSENYMLDNLSIKNSNDENIEYYEKDGKYYFDIKNEAITVNATFKEKSIMEEIVTNPNTITFLKLGFVLVILFSIYNLFISKKIKIKRYA